MPRVTVQTANAMLLNCAYILRCGQLIIRTLKIRKARDKKYIEVRDKKINFAFKFVKMAEIIMHLSVLAQQCFAIET